MPRKGSNFYRYQINRKIQKFLKNNEWKEILKLGYEIEKYGLNPMEFPLYNYAYNEIIIFEPEWVVRNVPKKYLKEVRRLEMAKRDIEKETEKSFKNYLKDSLKNSDFKQKKNKYYGPLQSKGD